MIHEVSQSIDSLNDCLPSALRLSIYSTVRSSIHFDPLSSRPASLLLLSLLLLQWRFTADARLDFLVVIYSGRTLEPRAGLPQIIPGRCFTLQQNRRLSATAKHRLVRLTPCNFYSFPSFASTIDHTGRLHSLHTHHHLGRRNIVIHQYHCCQRSHSSPGSTSTSPGSHPFGGRHTPLISVARA